MRKLIFLTTFVLTTVISCGSIFGQKNRTRDAEYFPKHEFYIQYGAPTIIELSSTLGPVNVNSANKMDPKNIVFSGVGAVGYNFSTSERLTFGIYAGISFASADMYSSLNEKKTPEYSSNIISYTGQLSLHWIYYEAKAVQVSSGVYAGLNYRDDITSSTTSVTPKAKPIEFAYHLTALKVRYGNMIGGFAEIGFGYRGLVNIGLSIRL